MTEPARPSLLTRLLLRWQRRAADALAWGKLIRPSACARIEGAAAISSARSSLFHLRMEQKHRVHYEAAALRRMGGTFEGVGALEAGR